MHKPSHYSIMPTKLKYKLMVTFCLMSVIPLFVGVYIASLFFRSSEGFISINIITVCLVMLFTLALSILGLQISRRMTEPFGDVAETARHIAEGDLDSPIGDTLPNSSDELDQLSRSLKLITKNARELLDKVETLSTKDKLTGLYNASYIRERLDEEIQRAIHYQTPCSFAYFNISHLDEYQQRHGKDEAEKLLRAIADIFNKHISQLDRAARLNQGDFAVIFPARNKKSAIEISEKVRREVMELTAVRSAAKGEVPVYLCGGISEDPIDGVSADMLLIKAQDRMKAARGKNSSGIEAFI